MGGGDGYLATLSEGKGIHFYLMFADGPSLPLVGMGWKLLMFYRSRGILFNFNFTFISTLGKHPLNAKLYLVDIMVGLSLELLFWLTIPYRMGVRWVNWALPFPSLKLRKMKEFGVRLPSGTGLEEGRTVRLVTLFMFHFHCALPSSALVCLTVSWLWREEKLCRCVHNIVAFVLFNKILFLLNIIAFFLLLLQWVFVTMEKNGSSVLLEREKW